MNRARNEHLWMRFHRLTPDKGTETLAIIVDEETAKIREWLLRAEKAVNNLDTSNPAAIALACGFLSGCIKGALEGAECPKD